MKQLLLLFIKHEINNIKKRKMDEAKMLAMQATIARLNNQTAHLSNGSYNNRFVEGMYGATAELKYEGPIKIVDISEESETNPKPGFEHLKTETRRITFTSLYEKQKSYWKMNIFAKTHPLIYEEVEEMAEDVDETTGMMVPQNWDGTIRVYDIETDVDFEFNSKQGDKTVRQRTRHFRVFLFQDDSLQTIMRRELRNRANDFVGAKTEISPDPAPSTTNSK